MDDFTPSRRELEREAHQEEMEETYEVRFHEFCWYHHLDPEDVGSVVEYEEWFEWQTSEGGRR